VATRPEIYRPNVAARPSFDLGKRPIHHDINNINVSRWNQYGHRAYVHRPWYAGHPGYWNRPYYASRPAWYWNRPWYNYHWHWHHGYWNYWITPPAFWLYSGLWAAALSPGASYVYYNPYYIQPATVVVQPVLDYSVPIPAPVANEAALAFPPAPDQQILESGAALPTAPPPAPDTSNETVTAANRQFESARAAFKAGNYVEAQGLVEKAIEKLPSDATLHEFRALTLFAQGRYKESAATLYAVLSAGPGWDWQTVSGLYADESAYTQQLRTLEQYMRANPDAAEGHFVLGYQYLVLGHKVEAIKQLEQVVRIQPDDKLSAALLKALTTESATAGPPAEPPRANER
jgi:tetratricopeptide (TPR) repeat protein